MNVEKPTISKFNMIAPLLVQKYERYLPTAFDESMSLLEKVNKTIEYLNQVGLIVDKVVQDWNEVYEWTMNDGLNVAVDLKLNDFVSTGVFTDLIETKIAPKISVLEESKMDKDTSDIGIQQINKNKGLIDQTYLHPTLLQQIAGTASINAIPAENSILLNQLTFVKPQTENLFNKDKAVVGAISGATGLVATSSTDFYSSWFIPVEVGSSYKTSHNLQSYALYNTNFEYVNGVQNIAGLNSVTIGSGVAYIRVSFFNANLNAFMFVKGSVVPTSYVPYVLAIEENAIGGISGTKLKDRSVSEQKLSMFVIGKNLFNPATATAGVYMNNANTSPNANLFASDFIEVTANTSYVYSTMRTISYFDANKAFISAESDAGYPVNKAFVTPPNTKYVRFSTRLTELYSVMMEKGTVATSFEKFGYKIPTLIISKDDIVGEQGVTINNYINIPPTIYVQQNKTFRIYDQNILKLKRSKYNLRYKGFGKQKDGYFEATLTTLGTVSLTIEVYENEKLLVSKLVNVRVTANRTTNIKALFIGDSTINTNNSAFVTGKVLSELGSNVTLLGSRGTGLNKHEGRGGWTAQKYRTGDSYEGVVNPFFNPATNDFDFSYYMTNNSYTSVDVVVIQLGINDLFSAQTDDLALSSSQQFTNNIDFIVSKIKSFNPNIKVALNVTIPPNESQDMFGEVYGVSQSQWRYKYNNAILVNHLIEKYQNQGILISTHLPIDVKTDFADGVHPNQTGYEKMGDSVVSYLNTL